jgi:protein-disulfide isomerase/uncharacterized membrane protein
MKKNRLVIAFLIVLASLGLHLYLMNTHYNFLYGAEGEKSMCSINEKLNCESVSISPYAYFLGIPIATWGASFHMIFVILFGMYFIIPERKDSLGRWLKTFSALSLLGTLVMATISFSMMQTYCIFCMTLYGLSVLLFLCLWPGTPKPHFIGLDDLKWKPILFLLVAVPIIAWILNDANNMATKGKTAAYIADYSTNWQNAPVEILAKPLLTKGAPEDKAKMVISEFADFQCIHCKDFVAGLDSFVSSKPDVRLQFFAFPIDGSCHPAWKAKQSEGKSCLLARAVFCAEKEKKGWQAHHWIFDRFGSEDNSHFEKMINDLHLDEKAFQNCLASDEAFHAIEENAKLGDKVKVEGTPTVFVNGKKAEAGNRVYMLEAIYKLLHAN